MVYNVDISLTKLCRNHLLGEHRELHAMWVVITENKKWYYLHPETLRWNGKLKAMYLRHDKLVSEIIKRVIITKALLIREKLLEFLYKIIMLIR